MPPPSALPPALAGRPFLVAEALALGVGRKRLRAADLRRPHRGVRVPRALEPGAVLDARCAALLLPPGAAFSGTTAVTLLDLPTPWSWERHPSAPVVGVPVPAPVEVAVPRGAQRPRISGVAVRPAALEPGTPLSTVHGVPVLHPAEVWAQRCADLPVEDAVALGDAVRHRLVDGAPLAAAVERLRGRAAREAAQAALTHVRPGVGSPAETRLRWYAVRDGLPEPVCGAAVPSGDHPVAWPDLSWPEARVAAEVDGPSHEEESQRHLDRDRELLMAQLGWEVVVVTARKVWAHPEACVAQVREVLRRRWPR